MKKLKRLGQSLLALCLTGAICSSVLAQTTYTWDGSSNSNWNTSSNWTPSGVPGSSDHVIIVSATNAPMLSANVAITNFTMTSGTADLNGYELTASGNVSLTGGQLNDGLLNQSSSGTTTITGVTVNCDLDLDASSLSVNSSTFKKPVDILKTNGPSNTFSGNTWEANTTIGIIGSSAILTIASSQPDTFLMDATFNHSGRAFSLGNSADVVFAGSEHQTLELGGSKTIKANRVRVNKPDGRLYLYGTLYIYSKLTFIKGIIEPASGSYIYFQSGSIASSVSNASFVAGPVEKAGNQAFTFPVGKNGVYRPISITAPSFSNHRFKAEYVQDNSDDVHSHSSKDISLNHLSENEHWTLTREYGTSNPKVTLSWDTLSSCGMSGSLSSIHVTGWSASGGNWDDLGNGGTTGNIHKGTVQTSSAVSNFNMFTLENDNSLDCYEIELTWSADTVIVDSLYSYYISSDNLPSGYKTALKLEGAGYIGFWTFAGLAHVDTVETRIHLNDVVGTAKATVYMVNQYGNSVDSMEYDIPYKRVSGDYLCECEPVECDHIFNGNFSDYSEVPNGYGQVSEKVDCWNKFVADGGTPEEDCFPVELNTCSDMDGTADFFHELSTSALVDIPFNFLSSVAVNDTNITSTEDSYLGITAWNGTGVGSAGYEYIMQNMSDPLIPGRTYRLKFYLQIADKSDRMIAPQVLFTNSPACQDNIDFIDVSSLASSQLLNATVNLSSGHLYDLAEWHEVILDFTATDSWSVITIGSFADPSQLIVGTNMWYTVNPAPAPAQSYWYLDEFELKPTNPEITQGASISVCTEDLPLTLNVTGSGTGSNIYTWSASPADPSLNGQESDMEIEVSPTVNTTYTVTVEGPNGCQLTDEIIVTLQYGPTGTISGPTDACDDDPEYSISFGGTHPKTWSVPAGATILSGQGTSTIDVDWGSAIGLGGIICVEVDDGTCVGTSCIEVAACCEPSGTTVGTETYVPDGSGNDVLGGSLNVTAWSITGQTFILDGTLTLNGDLTLDGCNIYAEEDAAIIVTSGNTLTITNNTHIRSCKDMWTGIVVNDGAEIIVDDNSLIEDALYAVFLQTNTTYTIDEAVFNKNYTHMFFWPASGSGLPSGTITNSYFLCQTTASVAFPPNANTNPTYTTLLPPYSSTGHKTFAGIYRYGKADFTLTVGATANGNLFQNANYGIYNFDGSLNSYNNTFKDVWDDANCTDCGMGVYTEETDNVNITQQNHFEDAQYGISSNYDNSEVIVNNNSFNNNFMGVYVEGADIPEKEITITENTMTNVPFGITCSDNPDAIINIGGENLGNSIDVLPLTGFLNFGMGIYVSETDPSSETEVAIVENTITNAIQGISLLNVLENSSISFNDVRMHDIDLGAGIQVGNGVFTYVWMNNVDGINKNTDQYGIHIDGGDFASLICNTTENAGIGIHMENTSDPQGLAKNRMDDNLIGLQLTDCFAFDVGTAATGNDNSWYGNDTYDTYTFDTDASSNYIYYSSAGYPFEPMSNNALNSGDEFQIANAINPLSWLDCPTGVGTQKTGSEDGLLTQEDMVNLILKALNDSVAAVNYPKERAWVRKYHLYQVLESREELRTAHPTLTAFYDSNRTANTGKLWQAHHALHVGQTESVAVQAQNQLQSVSAELKPERALQNLLQIMVDNATDIQYSMDTVLYQAQQHMQNVLGTDFQELPEPEMRIRKLNQEQYATVAELAKQCPYEYGPAVYMARSLVLRNDRFPKSYRNVCKKGSGKKGGDEQVSLSAKEHDGVKVYPNPAMENITVEFFSEYDVVESVLFTMYDISGRMVIERPLNERRVSWSILELDAGLYHYVVTDNGKPRWSGKQVIIR